VAVVDERVERGGVVNEPTDAPPPGKETMAKKKPALLQSLIEKMKTEITGGGEG
jgi:hypothetical protein